MSREIEQEINQGPPEPNAVESLLFETATPVEKAIRRPPDSPETLAQTSDSTSIRENQSRVERCRHGMIQDWCDTCQQSKKRIPKPDIKVSDENKLLTFDKLDSEPDFEEPEASLTILKKGSAPEELPPDTKVLHVPLYPSEELIRAVLQACPQLHILQLPPQFYRRCVQGRRTTIATLLEENDVKVVSVRINQSGIKDLNKYHDPAWKERREFLQNLEPKGKKILNLALQLKIPEAVLAVEFFCLKNQNQSRKAFVDLAFEKGVAYTTVRGRIMGLLNFLGLPSKDKQLEYFAAAFWKRFRVAVRDEAKRKVKGQFEKFKPLPEGLPPRQWPYFLAITRILQKSPGRFETLSEQKQNILNLYFGLRDGKYRPSREIGKLLDPPIARQAVESHRNQAIAALLTTRRERQSHAQIINLATAERCKHGMIPNWCDVCGSKKRGSKPDLEVSDEDELLTFDDLDFEPDFEEPEKEPQLGRRIF